MSSLREDIHKNDFLMDKVTKQLFFVIKIDYHNVWLRYETESSGDDAEILKMPKHLVNTSMIKVNPNSIRILYEDKQQKCPKNNPPDDIL